MAAHSPWVWVWWQYDDSDEDDDEEYEAEEQMPNMHFGLASRAALEAEEDGVAAPAVNIFLINAVTEGCAGLTAVYESFQDKSDRLLINDDSSPMVRHIAAVLAGGSAADAAASNSCCRARALLMWHSLVRHIQPC